MGDTAAAESRVAAVSHDVLGGGDALAPPERTEQSGIARLDSSACGEEVALVLDTQLRAQADTLVQQPLSIPASELENWVALAQIKGECGLVLAQEDQHVMVLGPGGATVPTPQCFRDALVAAANPSLCFLPLPATRVRVLTELNQTSFEDEVANLPEVRVAVIHRDRGVRSRWQRHMAFAGAEVLFDEVEDAALPTLGESAPDLLVIHEDALCDLARAGGWRDVRLQFSSLLVVSSTCASEIHPHDLVAEAADLLATHASLRTRIAEADVLVERVESLGPARWLRELQGYDGLVELRMHAPQGCARVRMDNGELHEASYWCDGEELRGTAALRALQDARFGSLIVGPPQQVADADPNERSHGVPSSVPPRRSTVAPPSTSSACESSSATSSDVSFAEVAEETASASAIALETAVVASPEAGSESTASSDTTRASELPSQLTGRAGATWRTRAITAGTLAVLATAGGALRLTAPTVPTSRPRPAVVTAPSGAAKHPARRASGEPSAGRVVVAPAADTPIGPGVTEAAAAAALGVAAPAAELAADAPPAAAPQQAPAPSAAATSSAIVGVGNEVSTGAGALPVRLRRWLQPTPAQQRVIDAFWARANKNFVRAERLLSEAHALDPNDSEAAYQLALTYARQGRLEQTLSWARKARELSPLDPAPVALEGDVHALRGQRLDAERVWKQCLQIRPGDPGCVRRLEHPKSRPGS
jgi:hypothetical protein